MPFFIASAITFYGVVKAQEAGVNSKSAVLSNVSGDELLIFLVQPPKLWPTYVPRYSCILIY